MKLFKLALFTIATSISFAQEIDVKLSGMVFNSGQDSIYLSQFLGDHYNHFHAAKLKEDGSFKIEASLPNPDYYILKVGDKHINLILRNDSEIQVYGDGSQINKFVNIVGSDESSKMFSFLQLMNNWQEKSDSATLVLQNDPSKREAINKEMAAAFRLFQSKQKSFVAQNANSAALFPVLSVIDVQNDFASYEAITKQLNTAFGDSPTIKNVNKQYVAMKAQMTANDPLAPGKPAPDFEEMLVDSTMMKLSDLKGKVVLLDFWASWCGPCRRENPNVVNLYNKYKDDGFTVMSVSLDKDRNRWIQAIEKDKLIWPYHVSDLKHWACKAAKLYGVRGIPFTVLIDQEGNIIGTKLRGEALHAELKRIFGH